MKTKCVISVLIISLFILLFGNIVYADMSAPMIEPYKAYVSNPEGANYYQQKNDILVSVGKLEYGDTITINYEMQENGVNYAYFQDGIIKIEDIKMANETSFDNNASKYDEPINITILANEGVKIYKGPAYIYPTTGTTIPKGKELTAYMDKEYKNMSPWYYVSYDGTSGWICILNGSVGYEANIDKIICPNTTNIYEDANGKKAIKTIPANTIITDFMHVDSWSQSYYVTYNGVSGYVGDRQCATPWDKYEWTVNYDNAKLYKTGSLNGEIIVDNIPVGTTLKSEYVTDIRAYGWMYTTYNGTKGWVWVLESEYDYEEMLRNEKEDKANQKTIKEVEEIKETKKDENDNGINNQSNTIVIEETKNNNTTEQESSGNIVITPKVQIIILCVFVAIIIGMTGIIILLLVNRKK